jgi:hypothetical protein
MNKHSLVAFESDFLDPGEISLCSCGWESEFVPSRESAIAEHQRHVREEDKEDREP